MLHLNFAVNVNRNYGKQTSMKIMLVRMVGKLKFSLIKSRHRACLKVAKATFKTSPLILLAQKQGENQNQFAIMSVTEDAATSQLQNHSADQCVLIH